MKLLYLSPFAPSPPAIGCHRRVQGLMAAMARRHEVTAVSLITPDLDVNIARRAMNAYCHEVVLVRSRPWHGPGKRMFQLRSLLSTQSFERRWYELPALREGLDGLLSRRAYDIVSVELPWLARQQLRKSPPGQPLPKLVLDEHNIEFDLARQQGQNEVGLTRRLYNMANWPKVRREELQAWALFDGVAFCSATDQARAHSMVPSLRSAVIPNSVDIEYFKPKPDDPPSDGRTIVFFGAGNYFPNTDGLLYFLREIWPRIARTHPRARVKIFGQHHTPEILAFQQPGIEVTGWVEDLRPHLARAAVSIVPLRIGSGTRFKILEGMAMAKPTVSSSIGAEGIDFEHGRNVLIADDPSSFAAAVGRVLDDRQLADRLGCEARALVEKRYSWDAAAVQLERFFREILTARSQADSSKQMTLSELSG